MSHDPQNEVSPKTIEQVYKPMNRRTFLKGAAASMVGVAGLDGGAQAVARTGERRDHAR